ncbi:unnamed protein product [Amoebophrya sp. A120]|nr:unnamed protein product [Amoebophrya sp. A120]|eukprot:GSA120T00013075001.1
MKMAPVLHPRRILFLWLFLAWPSGSFTASRQKLLVAGQDHDRQDVETTKKQSENKRGGLLFPPTWNETEPPVMLEQVHRVMQTVMPLYRVPNRQSELHWYHLCDPEKVAEFNLELQQDLAKLLFEPENKHLWTAFEEAEPAFVAGLRERVKGNMLNFLDFHPETLDKLTRVSLGAPASVASTDPTEPTLFEKVSTFRADHCDAYGPGGGMCIMQAHRYIEPQLRDRQKVLLNSNCQIWKPGQNSGMLTQLFHCPMGAPIAFFMLPKSGTSSAVNYIMDLEPYIKTSLANAMDAMLQRPKVMIDWLATELDYWGHMDKNEVVQDLSQRLMHRFPPDSYTQQHWTWMRFLPPANLCPNCCLSQKWRKKVVLARNPFVRMASMYQFAWLPTQRHPNEPPKEAERTDEDSADNTSAPPTNGGGGKRAGPYKDWKDFGKWLSRMLYLRSQWRELNGIGFTKDISDNFADKQNPKMCVNKSTPEMIQKAKDAGYTISRELTDERTSHVSTSVQDDPGEGGTASPTEQEEDHSDSTDKGFCVHLESEVDVSDIFHMRPFLDMLNDEVFLQINGPVQDLDDFFVLHLETIGPDLEELYALLCEEYNYCHPAPKKFPKVLPSSNTERPICSFDAKKVQYRNCETTWEALWTEETIGLVREHFAFDLEFFGYSDSPDYVMPLKWL